ncbi:Nem1-Spo7 phosphatase regulatory subunit [Podospora pseudopauciseta]|uniref:Nem1-Spo7 phosphatase regulatory subunit n=2 Tax=Podospora TaxID=5144 RepID=A0ABR0I2Z7_9PEZI|nr:Nem1-Spo7 phosphatase regulatory subunit [Podospora pseudopauciseta]KAK4683226.1 Nem1-Spo7 phosphatase regulatory subunit [Podospora pseudoanserina]
MADTLDSIVKGAPLSSAAGLTSRNDLSKTSGVTTEPGPGGADEKSSSPTGDPLSHTPSSPSMIYLNLLILEASLRVQYLELRARRRHHTFFLSLLTIWTAGFGYALFLAPREDGSGVGGSVYWMVETTERMCFLGGVMTGLLVWLTGIWERGVRWPRRWFTVSNRGLRGFNCKLVVMKRPWWKEALSTIGWFLTYGVFSNNGSSYRFVDPTVLREVDRELNLSKDSHPSVHVTNWDEEKGGHEEDLAPGGDYVKLLLLAKPFSPSFRENWELYRAEYWERENERRALLRVKLKERDLRLRREHGGWLWWLPWRKVVDKPSQHHPEKVAHHPHHPRHAAVLGEHKRTRSGSGTMRRGSMNLGTPGSRSTTPTLEVDDQYLGVARKASTSSTASEKKRKKLGSASKTRPRVESRSVTPEITSPLAKESTPTKRV